MKYLRATLFGAVTVCLMVTLLPLGAMAYTTPALTVPGILAYTNAERFKAGLPLLESNVVLSQVASVKLNDLFSRQYFAHEAPTGENVADLAKQSGYQYLTIGENLALGDFGSNEAVIAAWMNSPGHRKNILSPTYGEIGVAVGRGVYKGRTVWMAVQSFGLPRSNCPIADQELRAKIEHLGDTLSLMAEIATLRKEAYEALRSTSPSRPALIESYNLVVSLYNERVDEYRTLVETYNNEVDTSNICVTELLNH